MSAAAIIQAILNSHRAGNEAGYAAGLALLIRARGEIAGVSIDETLAAPNSIYSDGWQDAMGEALAIIDKIIASKEGEKQ